MHIDEGDGKMKTIDDLFKLGLKDPVVHGYLNLYQRQEMSLEQALIGMVFTLNEQKNEVTINYTKHLRKCPTPTIQR